MTSLIPFNGNAEDEMFDRGLERLLAGDMSGLDDIDPKLHDTVLEMVGLANTAGWIGVEPGPPLRDTRPVWVRWGPAVAKVAAILLVGLLGATGFLAWRVIDGNGDRQAEPTSVAVLAAPTAPGEFSYVSEEQAAVGGGVCGREPRSAAEVAGIVRSPFAPRQGESVGAQQSFTEVNVNVTQVVRDWTACLVSGEYDRAMAYESENFLRAMADASGIEIDSETSDAKIATVVARQHRNLRPMAHGEDMEIVIYVINWSSSGDGLTGIEVQFVPVNPAGEWVEWPSVVTFVYENDRWVIQLADREGSPATPVP